MMKTIWDTKANYLQKANKMPDNLLFPTGKEIRYMCLLLFCDYYQ